MASKGSRGDAEGDDVTVALSVEKDCEATASGGSVKRRKLVSSSDVSDAGGTDSEERADKVALCGSESSVGQKQLNLGQKDSGNEHSILLPTHRVKGLCSRCGLGGHRESDCDVGIEKEVGAGSAPVVTEDGADKVALCGSESSVGQQQLNLGQKNSGNEPSILLPTHGVEGLCSRCGIRGHRDSDCDVGIEEEVGGGSAPVVTEDGSVPDMACPCGSGKCVVLTSNTAKNPGRKFYSCRLPPNNGGCYFFKWCDQPYPGPAVALKVSNKYSTPVFKGKSCDLFKWLCDRAAQHTLTVVDPETSKELSKNSSTQQFNERDSRCYRCGEEGHWHRDCPNRLPSSSDTSENTTAKPPASSSSNLCFKCGEDGHWARDCPKKLSSSSTDASVGTVKKHSGSDKCFKCRKLGHWARDCPDIQKG